MNPSTGPALRDAALKLLACKRRSWIRKAQRALLNRLLETGSATTDDVRAMVELPSDLNPKTFGVVPVPLAQAGIINSAGFKKSVRPVAHARPIVVWELTDRDAALDWLETHRENDEPEEPPKAVTGLLPFMED